MYVCMYVCMYVYKLRLCIHLCIYLSTYLSVGLSICARVYQSCLPIFLPVSPSPTKHTTVLSSTTVCCTTLISTIITTFLSYPVYPIITSWYSHELADDIANINHHHNLRFSPESRVAMSPQWASALPANAGPRRRYGPATAQTPHYLTARRKRLRGFQWFLMPGVGLICGM